MRFGVWIVGYSMKIDMQLTCRLQQSVDNMFKHCNFTVFLEYFNAYGMGKWHWTFPEQLVVIINITILLQNLTFYIWIILAHYKAHLLILVQLAMSPCYKPS